MNQSPLPFDKSANLVEASLTLEREILGSSILDMTGHQAGTMVAMLKPEDFVSSLNRAVYQAIKALLGRGVTVLDYNLVIAQLQMDGVFNGYENCVIYLVSLGDYMKLSNRLLLVRVQELQRVAAARKRMEKAVSRG
jgi:replicative DNA helicase